jgi:hypothetical protein
VHRPYISCPCIPCPPARSSSSQARLPRQVRRPTLRVQGHTEAQHPPNSRTPPARRRRQLRWRRLRWRRQQQQGTRQPQRWMRWQRQRPIRWSRKLQCGKWRYEAPRQHPSHSSPRTRFPRRCARRAHLWRTRECPRCCTHHIVAGLGRGHVLAPPWAQEYAASQAAHFSPGRQLCPPSL